MIVFYIWIGGDGDHAAAGELGRLERFEHAFGHLVDNACSLGLLDHVEFVEDHNHLVARDLANDQTLGRLRLHALLYVDHEKHHVNDLRTANDRLRLRKRKKQPSFNLSNLSETKVILSSELRLTHFDERSVSRAVDQCVLDKVVTVGAQLGGRVLFADLDGKRGEAEVERDSTLAALRVLVKAGRARHRAQRFGQTCLAAVDVSEHANVEIQRCHCVHSRSILKA